MGANFALLHLYCTVFSSGPAQELCEPPEQDHHLLHGAGLVKLKFAAMNLKKTAGWKWYDSAHFLFSLLFSRICAENPVAA